MSVKPDSFLSSLVIAVTDPEQPLALCSPNRHFLSQTSWLQLDIEMLPLLRCGAELLAPDLGVMKAQLMEAGTVLDKGDLTITSFLVNHDPVRPAVGYRFDYLGRSVVISGDAIVTPSLIDAATEADLLLQDSLSLPIIKSFEKASAGSRMEKIFSDIQDYHAHTSDLADLVTQSGVRQLALYHLVPPPQNALFEKIFSRDLPQGTVLTRNGMFFVLPTGTDEIKVITP